MALRTIGSNEELVSLAEMASAFAAHAMSEDGSARDAQADIRAGKNPASWQQLVENGLHALHIDEKYGGSGAGLEALAVAIEQFGASLYSGNLVSTSLTAALLQEAISPAGGNAELESALKDIVQGKVASLGISGVVAAEQNVGGILLNGKIEPVLAAQAAELFVVRAEFSDGVQKWVLIHPKAAGVTVTELDSLDITQALGQVTFVNSFVADAFVFDGPSMLRAEQLFVALLSADISGVATKTAELAVEHATLRTQFRRSLSSFQAIQQRLAMMYLRAEQVRAAAWDAVYDQAYDEDQAALLRHQLVLSALQPAVENALEYIKTLGAMGFTWEHDAHLFWRRALQAVALAGPAAKSELELGRLAQFTSRQVSLADADDLPELRAEIAATLNDAGDPSEGILSNSSWLPRKNSSWQRRLAESRLVSVQLPEPYGRAADPRTQAVLLDEFAQRGLMPPSLVIGEWVVPTIIAHGTKEQQERFVPATLNSEIFWCQLFSEPGAGSDLASLTTRAEKVEGGWVVTGQKIWNSLADVADWGALLVRMDPDSQGRRGLGYLLVEMNSPGIDVRPIRQATGFAEFCEVFLDSVFVPDHQVVGDPGDGWKLATTTLANERLRMGEALDHGSADRFLTLLARTEDLDLKNQVITAYGRAVARENVLGALTARSAVMSMAGLDTKNETSILKLANILAQQQGSMELVALQGPMSACETTITAGEAHGDMLDHIGLPAALFGGGTIDIQLSVIARGILGLV